jgi:hypothetical protein
MGLGCDEGWRAVRYGLGARLGGNLNEPIGTIIAKLLIQFAVMVAFVVGLAFAAKSVTPPPVPEKKPTIGESHRVDPYASYFYSRK